MVPPRTRDTNETDRLLSAPFHPSAAVPPPWYPFGVCKTRSRGVSQKPGGEPGIGTACTCLQSRFHRHSRIGTEDGRIRIKPCSSSHYSLLLWTPSALGNTGQGIPGRKDFDDGASFIENKEAQRFLSAFLKYFADKYALFLISTVGKCKYIDHIRQEPGSSAGRFEWSGAGPYLRGLKSDKGVRSCDRFQSSRAFRER